MGLFDKKNCDVCGEKIGLLGNKKLEDGNLCKDCAKKLSPFFSDRKNSTVEEIKKQLQYRQENEAQLKFINPDKTFGVGRKVYVDTANKKFVVTASNDWRSANPDIIDFAQVLGCDTEIEETKKELYETDEQGKQKSYEPPRYEYSYKFKATIRVNSPWFDEIDVDLSFGQDPESRFTDEYRQFEQQMYELKAVLTGTEVNYTPTAGTAGSDIMDALGTLGGIIVNGFMNNGTVTPSANTTTAQGTWQCTCGTVNNGNFCSNCGSKKPVSNTLTFRCSRCGWAPQEGSAPPKFCPQCGDPFDMSDIAQ